MEQKVQEQIKELEILSTTDALTGILNRGEIEKELQRSLHVYEQYKIPSCLMIIDIDHFKAVNDTFGHKEGDRVLVKVVEIIKKHIRQTDLVGRWGGEEFLVITHNVTAEGAVLVAEKLRHIVHEEVFGIVGHKTISVGISCFKEGLSVDEIFNRADQALYEAKNTGRNKVVLYKS